MFLRVQKVGQDFGHDCNKSNGYLGILWAPWPLEDEEYIGL